METVLWEGESDNYTRRAIELHKNNLYNNPDTVYFGKHAFEIISKFIIKPKNILDLGCAFGENQSRNIIVI